MTEPSAKVIADSVSPLGHRVTTIEADIHRFVLAELNTHRVFSRNSASSRAIPLHKQLERVREDTAVPVKFPLEQPGMSGGDEVVDLDIAREVWQQAAFNAAYHAETLGKLGVHKSVANRLIEPFGWHTVVITATAWDNFFALRCNPMAQPEIRVAAEAMKAAYDASEPRKVGDDEWHLPYIQDDERNDMPVETQVKVSAARCARVSYLTQNGVRDFEQDVQLYDRLTSAAPMHASPLEHVATPHAGNVQEVGVASYWENQGMRLLLPKYGNLLGWHQHRFDVEVAKNYQAFA